MTSLTAHGICNAIGGQLVSGPFERVASGGVCTDSRAARMEQVMNLTFPPQ